MKKFYTALLFTPFFVWAQEQDSVALISEVQIDAYRKPAKLINSTKSVAVAGASLLDQNAPERMLEAVNLLPGSKLEERSPGSYRFSVRGSTLRSPFGVRNIKVYLDDFSLSDASGNTYLNALDPEVLGKIEIFKGPEGGEFGSFTGGTVLLKTKNPDEKAIGITGGSFNLFKGNFSYAKMTANNNFSLYSSYQTTDSYREQSALERKFFLIKNNRKYSEKGEFNSLMMYSDLHYETPGGLTLEQMQQNPRQARLKTSTLPSAKEQNAGINNKLIFGGISHQYRFSPHISHFIALQGIYNDLRNPFITNFEKRFENNLALRTHFNWESNYGKTALQSRLGFEGATSATIVKNFDNNFGIAGNPQNFDKINAESGFIYFAQKAVFAERLFLDASVSYNLMNYSWNSLFPQTETGSKNFEKQWLPDFGISYLISDGFSVRAKISKGNSAPTAEEIRSSTQQINLSLNPEFGWNKEIGIRKQFGNFLYAELAAFDFRMKHAIVRKQDENGNEYFENAGETVQKGLEFILETRKIQLSNPVLQSIKLWFSGNVFDFKFKNYQTGGNDFSGNQLTGVPSTSLQNLISLNFFDNLKMDIAHFYNSEIPLNDANSVIAEPTLIGNISLHYPFQLQYGELALQLRIQNLYNTKYSLGHDINAFGGRFYNPAATRNYSVGLQFQLK